MDREFPKEIDNKGLIIPPLTGHSGASTRVVRLTANGSQTAVPKSVAWPSGERAGYRQDASLEPSLRTAGWSLLAAGFFGAAYLDPTAVLDPALAAAEHRNIALIGFAFVLLSLAEMKRQGALSAARRTAAWWLIHHGAISYAAGCVVGLFFQPLLLLAPLGALGVVAGLALLLSRTCAGWENCELRYLLWILLIGSALEVVLSFYGIVSEVLAASLADPNMLPMQMLRLARAAAMTLPVLALLYRRLAERRALASAAASWGCLAIFAGAALMPAVLCLASWVDPKCKYLLPLPAMLVFFACSIAVRLAREAAGRAEYFGWLLIATSMGAGMLMGTYSFEGPLPPPKFVGDYADFARLLIRRAHSYGIVFGIAAIFAAREQERSVLVGARGWLVGLLIPMGSLTTAGLTILVAMRMLPVDALALGPGVVGIAAAACAHSRLLDSRARLLPVRRQQPARQFSHLVPTDPGAWEDSEGSLRGES